MEFAQNLSETMAEYAQQSQSKACEDYYSDHGNHSDSYNDAATTY